MRRITYITRCGRRATCYASHAQVDPVALAIAAQGGRLLRID